MWNIDSAFAQLSGDDNDIIQLTSTSTYTDDFGNLHIIGEVNNTSFDPQTNILITTILSDTTNNTIVGNHSAFSSIGTLRTGELSPFDILIPDPQIVGKFNFIEFSTSSQPATIEKPSTLVLNGSSSFVDNVGNLHITGNIVNQGQTPEQLLNIAATFYDNSSLGIVGTQSFGLNVSNLTQNQMTPFDITITGNKTKSQAAFYSLNMDSTQSSMSPPFNPKFSFDNGGGTTTEQIFTGELFAPFPPLLPLVNNNQGSNDNGNDNNDDNSGSGDNGNNDLDCDDIDKTNFPVGSNDPNDFDRDNDGIGCEADDINGTSNNDLDCDDIDKTNFPVGSNDPNDFDRDNDGIGCEADDINNNNGNGSSDDLNCGDIAETNITVGNNDPNNLDADGDGIGCESQDNTGSSDDLNCSDIGGTNLAVGSNDPNNLDADGDGIGCETAGGNDGQTNDDDSKRQEQPTEQTTDPRNDPKYDSIDWQADDPEENLTIEEMDEILEEQQNEEQQQSGEGEQPEQDTTSNGSDEEGSSTNEANGDNEDNSDEENNEESDSDNEDNSDEENNEESDSDNN